MRLAYWIYEGTAHHGIGRIANSLKGVHAVFHAPLGDDYVNVIHTMLERTPNFPRATTSVVTGRDLAQGTNRLPDTLEQVEARFKPELIIVSASCSTTLLQENLNDIVGTANIDTEVFIYEVNPFRVQETEAAEGLFTALVEKYAEKQELTEEPSINIIGPASLGFHVRSDVTALRRMMATLGVKINVVAPYSAGLTDLKKLPAAWLNVVPYHELGEGAAKHLEEKFGMTSMYDTPIGIQPTMKWINELIEKLNAIGAKNGKSSKLKMPPLTAFSLDGMSAPSGVPWFTHSADMESFSMKRAFVFGDATRTVSMVKFLHDELGMEICGAGTYLHKHAAWVREQLEGYLPDDLIVTEHFQDIAQRIEADTPDLVCGTQMERHSCRKVDVPCMVTSAPTHIENHLLGYYPMLGFDGADVIADRVYTTSKLGLEKHLIDFFGDAGLDYEEENQSTTVVEPAMETAGETTASSAQATEPATAAATPGTPLTGEPVWAADGEAMLKKIPFFVRKKAKLNTEKFAKENGYATITAEVVRLTKESLGGG